MVKETETDQEKYPLISVIVPVYNVEKYLDKCIRSILEQTYKNLELILVDDGSTDGSSIVCDVYAEKDARINVIHKSNGGLSSARNAGLEIANGMYISFVDSDDYISNDMYECLLKAIVSQNASMAICGFVNVDKTNGQETILSNLQDATYSKSQAMEQLLEDGANFISSCNKLFNKTLFQNIRFPIGKLNEDQFVIHQIINSCDKVTTVSRAMYYYLTRDGSIMHSEISVAHLDDVEAVICQYDFCKENGYDYLLPQVADKLKGKYDGMRGKVSAHSWKERRRIWTIDKMFRNTITKSPIKISWKYKICYLCPGICFRIYNLLKGH